MSLCVDSIIQMLWTRQVEGGREMIIRFGAAQFFHFLENEGKVLPLANDSNRFDLWKLTASGRRRRPMTISPLPSVVGL